MPIFCYATSEHKGCQVPIGHETSMDKARIRTLFGVVAVATRAREKGERRGISPGPALTSHTTRPKSMGQ
jgi:hypothetical protein